MMLRRAKKEERLDKELESLAKNQLNVIDLCRDRDYAYPFTERRSRPLPT
jgi:hypothetical protein